MLNLSTAQTPQNKHFTPDDFNWKLIERKAKTERDLAVLRRRERELSSPVVQLYGSLDAPRQAKLKRLRDIIADKENYLEVLRDAVHNH